MQIVQRRRRPSMHVARAGTALAIGAGALVLSASPAAAATINIADVQGSGATSPLVGQTVTVEGVITGIDNEQGASFGSGNTINTFPADMGFWLQEQDSDADGNAATSDGVFIANVANPTSYPIGTRLTVTGVVRDGNAAPAFGQTRIQITAACRATPSTCITLNGTAAVPTPVTIDPVAAGAQGTAKAYYESLEGMRVTLANGVARSGGTNKFGELFLVPGTLGGPPDQSTLLRTDPVEAALIGTVEDAGSGNPANPYRPPSPSTTEVVANLGDTVQNLTGPLAFSFSNYKIAPQVGAMPTIVSTGVTIPYTVAAAQPGDVRIASFNVENYFEVGGALDGGTVSTAEFADKTAGLTQAIGARLRAPDVVAVQEVDKLATLQALAASLGTAGFGTYTAYLQEGNDNRGIDVGFLVKNTLTVNSVTQYGLTAANPTSSTCADVSGRLFDRPPLALDATSSVYGSFVVFTNHFSSKAAPDACRNAQAAFVRDTAATLEASGRKVLVTGDLNAFEDETPLAQLQAGPATLTNQWSVAPARRRYSFQFNGVLQTLDHIAVSDNVDSDVVGFEYVHLNSDAGATNIADGTRLSDHDPPLITLRLDPVEVSQGPVVWLAAMLTTGLLCAVAALSRRPCRTTT
jgi:predicted extracellular nuclease